MPTPFLSSEEYDERAHQLYNEGQYDQALDVLREGLALYPNAVELHIGVGYARLARDEFAWARRSFEEALILDPEHEDALAGLGETLLKFGRAEAAVKSFRRVLELGYQDDVDLMLQVGRALFREGMIDEAKEFFDIAVDQTPESAEAVALVGYAQHRLGDDNSAISTLRRALQLDNDHAEARIYLGNILYDRGDYEAALYHLDRTSPSDHWDELGIWRLVELKKTTMGRGAKANHLAYLGDATIGERVNVGAGTITCNYDGVAKHPTVIEDGAFIGSDSQLIAPVRIGRGAYVAAGSSITDDVPPESLAIARGKQVNKEGWTRKKK